MEPSSSSPGRTAWLIVALLFPVALLNYLDRQMLAAMKGSVMGDIRDIGSDENWGFLLGSFKWVYAAFSPIGGYLADKLSRKKMIVFSLIAWSLVTWGTAHASSYTAMLWTRALMGVSEAFYIPAALALIADFHFGSTRSRAVGIHQIGIYAGVIAGSFSGYVADNPSLGWRWAFDACGVVGVLYALPLLLLLREAPRSATAEYRSSVSVGFAVRGLLRNRDFILLLLYFTLPAIAGWVVRDWMPAILRDELGLQQGPAGVSAVVWWQGAAIVTAILGGWLADRWMHRTVRGRVFASALGMSLIIPALLGIGWGLTHKSLWLAVIFLVLYGLGWGLFDCNNMPILCQITRPELRATGYGVMNFVSISIGGFADWGFGVLRDRKVPLTAIFSLIAMAAAVSLLVVLLIRPQETKTQLSP
jgi:MFS transporter, Spinster family, sphingosine-1-phosphate transporter